MSNFSNRVYLYDRLSYAGSCGGDARKRLASGMFHRWADWSDGDERQTLAVVELDNGVVETWPADRIVFETPYIKRVDSNPD